jgi:BASS family bile acid:Na+ symporter
VLTSVCPVAVYGIVMFFPTAAFADYLNRRTTVQRAGSRV